MAYVSERMSEEDYDKYSFTEMTKGRYYGGESHWAIDRDKDMWIRKNVTETDRENPPYSTSYTEWGFYIKGDLIIIKTKDVENKTKYDREKKEQYFYRQILELEIPEKLENQKEQILKYIKEAFEEALGDPFSRVLRGLDRTCKIDLEYNGELV